MNEQDKAAFEEWYFGDSSNQCGHPESIAKNAFEAGMVHYDKQAVQVNEQLLCALTNLRQVVRERNSLGMDWMDLFDRLMEALIDSKSAIEAAEKLIGEP